MIVDFFKPSMTKICFIITWLLYIFMELFRGRIDNLYYLQVLLFTLMIYYLYGCIFEFLFIKNKIPKNTILFALVMLDQISKVIVFRFIGESEKKLVWNFIKIKAKKNVSNSALLNFLSMEFNLVLVLVIKILIIGCLLYLYDKVHIKCNEYWTKIALYFILAGSICSLIDTLFWGYSYDFIYIPGFIHMDLKDIYIDIGIGAVLNILFVNSNYS